MTFKSTPRASGDSAKAAAPASGSKPKHGTPRFLSTGRATIRAAPPARDSSEMSADHAARAWTNSEQSGAITTGSHASQHGKEQAQQVAQRANAGSTLPTHVQQTARDKYSIDASSVRVHTDAQANRFTTGMGANAVTAGNHIFFARGQYAPGTPAGEHLLAHELAHVAQQGGEPRALQFDLAMTLPVALGWFDISMITQAAVPATGTGPGMMGTITFNPEPNGPYSSEIGLIQAVNTTDVGGATNPVSGMPVNWANVGAGAEAGRNELGTTGLDGAPRGWTADVFTANARGTNIGPNYIEHAGIGGPNQFGWLRDPTDLGPASLWDYPSSTVDLDYDFETVAKGTDNQTIYGSLLWGFNVRSGAVVGSSEYAHAADGASATFEEALERFRGFFVHEPVVLYFNTNVDVPMAGEELKLAGLADYLTRYPDVTVMVLGYADERGKLTDNFDLAERRANSVASLLGLEGIPAGRIPTIAGIGATSSFSQHGTPVGTPQPQTAGRLQANRRVVISFEHSVSGYPIVMP
jgi:outer membrane protein OmpA-like peptidoglycan-associated protein